MAKIVGVKFRNTAKTYYFAPAENVFDYPENSGVIVETAKGLEYAKVVFNLKEVSEDRIVHPLKPIIRRATQKDEELIAELEKKIPETTKKAQEIIEKSGLDMKLISVEYSFDGKKLVIYFSADGRVDFRELVKDLASCFHVRIELRQIGVRDETKLLGGIAPCGRTCCCAGTMPDFGRATIKMAKNQGLHLNPSKISGLCGRLMCCLEYENDYYAEVFKKMPKVGGMVKSPEGEGIVVSNDMLKLITKVKISKPDGTEIYKDFPTAELEFKRNVNKDANDGSENIDDEMKKLLD